MPSLFVEFRKRLTEEILGDINEIILEYNAPDDPDDDDPSGFHEGGSEDQDSNMRFLLSFFQGANVGLSLDPTF